MQNDNGEFCSGLSEKDCLELVKFTSDMLTEESAERAVRLIMRHVRDVFGLSCISVREIIHRPFSLRFTYEELQDPGKTKRINETLTFSQEVWEGALKKFDEDGCYFYNRGGESSPPQLLGGQPDMLASMLQIPMYSGRDFLGTVDFVDFEHTRCWNVHEVTAVKICANLVCQYLCRLNATFMAASNRNEYDPLTGLLDYRVFEERLDSELPKMLNGGSVVAVVYTDINRFKYINEVYGYKKGDELLRALAQSMSIGVKHCPQQMISRVHSDNFVSAAPLPADILDVFPEFIQSQNQRSCALLQEICPDVRIRLNTGICYVSTTDANAATAVANANLARKIAHSENQRKPLVFSNDMMSDIKYQEYLNNELPKAIKNHELKVYYQPKISCEDDSLYGAEALVRWIKPDGKFIYPDQFIPLFEKNGNIVDVDFYVYREVFAYLRKRLDAGLPVVPISMNVSRVHLNSDKIIPYIKSLMKEFKMPPELVEFELTENIYIKNFNKADEFIKSCREMNIAVSMDDFGSGYSSLNVMSELSIDTLKIDRVFLKNDELSDNERTVLESMINMAKKLGMNVLCEGVETQSQSEFLKKAKCDIIQGYYYGKPMDEESFSSFTLERMK